jgi:hypothetical protein
MVLAGLQFIEHRYLIIKYKHFKELSGRFATDVNP